MSILEYKRRKSDRETNSRSASVWNRERNEWRECQWRDILVGRKRMDVEGLGG